MMAGTMATAAYAILSRRKNMVVSLGQSGGEFDWETTVEGLQVLRAGNHNYSRLPGERTGANEGGVVILGGETLPDGRGSV